MLGAQRVATVQHEGHDVLRDKTFLPRLEHPYPVLDEVVLFHLFLGRKSVAASGNVVTSGNVAATVGGDAV